MLNTNGKISPVNGEPIPWTIEHVSYIDTMPNFTNDLRYDSILTTSPIKNISPKQMSLERTKIYLNIDGNTKETFVDQLFKFHDTSYKINSAEGLSAEALIRYHGKTDDGTDVNQLAYLDLSAISHEPTYGYTGSVDNVTRIYWDASDFKIKAFGVTMSYENGLLKTVSEEKNLGTVDTVGFALSQE